jgi:hypothetical protein
MMRFLRKGCEMMHNKIKLDLYMICLILYSIIKIISISYLDTVIPFFNNISLTIEYVIIISLLLLFIMKRKISVKKLLLTISIITILLLIFIYNQDRNLLLVVLFIITFPEKNNIKKYLKNQLVINSIGIVLILLACRFGIIQDYTFIQRDSIRHSFGFVSANAFSNFLTATLFMYTYIKKDEMKLHNVLISLIILFIVYHFTYSRFAFYFGILNILVVYIYGRLINKNKGHTFATSILTLSKYLFAILLLLSICGTIFFSKRTGTETFIKINDFFTGRLQEMVNFYDEYGFHLVGRKITTVGVKDTITSGATGARIDTSYINGVLRYGIAFMFLLSHLYYKLGNYLKENKKVYEAIYVLFICIMGFTENIIMMPYFNISLLFIAEMINKEYMAKNRGEKNVFENN